MRQRRRRLIAAGVFAAAMVVGLGVWAAFPHGKTGVGGAKVSGPPAVGRFTSSTSDVRMPVDHVGSSGGVTWVLHGSKLWLSTDAGRTWRLSAIPLDPWVSSTDQIRFFGRTGGWIASDGRNPVPGGGAVSHWELARTSDAGRRWEVSTPSPCAYCFHASLSFLDSREGYALVWGKKSSRLLSTGDAGGAWNLVAHLRIAPPAVVTFADHRHGVIVKWTSGLGAGQFRPFRTADGGHTWTAVSLGGSRVYRGWLGFPSVTVARGTFVIPAEQVEKRGLRPVVYTSSDGGASWQSHSAPRQVFFGYELFNAPAPDTWVAMDAHTRHFFLTTNAGRTWREVATPGNRLLWRVRQIVFTSARVGWGVLDDFSLVGTTDGGLHWTAAGPRQPKRGPAAQCLAEHLRLSTTHRTSLPRATGEYLRVTNTSASPCWLRGWPSVVAVDANGKIVRASHAVFGTAVGDWRPAPHQRPPTITIGPGRSAYAVVEGGKGATCPTARQLRVNPASNGSLILAGRPHLPLCPLAAGKPQLEVSLLVPTSALAH